MTLLFSFSGSSLTNCQHIFNRVITSTQFIYMYVRASMRVRECTYLHNSSCTYRYPNFRLSFPAMVTQCDCYCLYFPSLRFYPFALSFPLSCDLVLSFHLSSPFARWRCNVRCKGGLLDPAGGSWGSSPGGFADVSCHSLTTAVAVLGGQACFIH